MSIRVTVILALLPLVAACDSRGVCIDHSKAFETDKCYVRDKSDCVEDGAKFHEFVEKPTGDSEAGATRATCNALGFKDERIPGVFVR